LFPAQICDLSRNQIDCGVADNGAADGTAGDRTESQTGRRLADPQLCIVSLDWPKWREPEQICPGMTGHPDMPEFTFDAKDVGAIIAYLKSIQQR
jgi:hypothetical protein